MHVLQIRTESRTGRDWPIQGVRVREGAPVPGGHLAPSLVSWALFWGKQGAIRGLHLDVIRGVSWEDEPAGDVGSWGTGGGKTGRPVRTENQGCGVELIRF